jgi:adenine-specific DNA-methyltransferase
MATGIVKGEKVGEDALTADAAESALPPLPQDTADVTLRYSDRLPLSAILSPIARPLALYRDGHFKSVQSIADPNCVVLADNYYAMQSMMEELAGKVGLIYLDPPFQTGMEFHSRQLSHAYKDTLGRAPYLEFMRRRLVLMRELLADSGSLYLHIGHQMVCHLKIILDEIFGPQNFRNLIIRRKCSSKNYTRNQYPNLHDYILFYTRSKRYTWNQPGTPPDEEWIAREYPKIDKRGRRYKLVPIHAPGIRGGETGQPWRGKMPPKGKHWQLPPQKLDELDAAGDIHWSRNANPRRKVYLTLEKQVSRTDYWGEFRDAHHQSVHITGYPTEKNLGLLRTIVAASSDPGDLVLDPFCGSGTTLHAARDLSRRWVGVDASYAAVATTVRRLVEGLEPMGDYVERRADTAPDLFGELVRPADVPEGRATVDQVAFDLYLDESFVISHLDAANALVLLLTRSR